MVEALGAVSGYAVVVAITTLPVLAVIAVLLETGKAARGWQLTAGYAVGLTALFAAASFGLGRLPLPHVRIRGVTELAAGVLLLAAAGGFWLWRRSRAGRPPRTPTRRTHPAMTGARAILVGAQFALHPENLALTFAAASHVIDVGAAERIGFAVWFAAVGVSTVAVPSLAFAVAGERTRERLTRIRTAIDAHGVLITVVLLSAVGALLVGIGLWRVLSP